MKLAILSIVTEKIAAKIRHFEVGAISKKQLVSRAREQIALAERELYSVNERIENAMFEKALYVARIERLSKYIASETTVSNEAGVVVSFVSRPAE